MVNEKENSIEYLLNRINQLETAIRKHRDEQGDDRCWQDDEELYSILPEGYTPTKRDTSVELELCKKFIESRNNPKTEYINPQREIERLNKNLDEVIKCMSILVGEREYFCPTTRKASETECLDNGACFKEFPDQSSWCSSCYAKNAIRFMDDSNYQKACQIIDEYYKQKEALNDKK